MIEFVPDGFIYSKSDAWAEYAIKKWNTYDWFHAGRRANLIPRDPRYLKNRINTLAAHLFEDTGDPEADTARAVMAATKWESKFWTNELRGRIGRQRVNNRRSYEKWELAWADETGEPSLPEPVVDGGFVRAEYRMLLEELDREALRVMAPGQYEAWRRVLAAGGRGVVELKPGETRQAFGQRWLQGLGRLRRTSTWWKISQIFGNTEEVLDGSYSEHV